MVLMMLELAQKSLDNVKGGADAVKGSGSNSRKRNLIISTGLFNGNAHEKLQNCCRKISE